MKIRTKLFWGSVGLAFTMLTTTSAVIYSQSRGALQQRVEADQLLIGHLQRLRVQQWVEGHRETAALLSTRPSWSGPLYDILVHRRSRQAPALLASLRSVPRASSNIQAMHLLHPDGRVILSSSSLRPGARLPYPLPERPEHLTRPEVTIVPAPNAPRGLVITTYVVPYGGAQPAVMVAESSPDILLDTIIAAGRVGETGETTLLTLNRQGEPVVLTPLRFEEHAQFRSLISRNDHQTPAIQGLIDGREGLARPDSVDYRKHRVVAAVYLVPGTPWVVVFKIDREEALAPVRGLFYVLLGVIALGTGLSAGLAHWMSQRLTRPLGVLTKAAESSAPIPPQLAARGDEVGLLAGALAAREKALRESEARFASLVQSGVLGIITTRFSGAVSSANDAFLTLVGYSREDLEAGRIQWKELTPPEYLEADERAFRGLHTPGGARPWEKELIRKDGSRVPVLIGLAPVGPGTEEAVCFILDLTDRKRADEELARSRQLFERIAEATPDILYVYDLQQGRNIFANREVSRILGYAPQEVLEMGSSLMMRLIHPEDLARLGQNSSALDSLADGEFLERFYRMRHADGSWRWLRCRDAVFARGEDGGVRQILGLAQDITEQRHAEEALRYISANARCVLWHADVEETGGEYCRWSAYLVDEEAAQRFLPLEVPPDGTYLRQWYRAVLPEDQVRRDAAANRSVRAGEGYRYEFRCRQRNGEVRWLQEDTQVETVARGRWRVVGICTDITERKRLEEELRRHVEELGESDRRKDEFLAMLAHELRNPLAPIVAAAEILRLRGAGDPPLLRQQAIIERQARHLSRMVDDLLEVSRINEGKIELRHEPVELAEIVEQAVNAARPLIDSRGHRLEVNLPDGPAQVTGDPTRLVQVVVNLLNNAAKYTDPGGEIQLSVEIADPRIADWGLQIADWPSHERPTLESSHPRSPNPQSAIPNPQFEGPQSAVIRVRDNGRGIEAELLPRIFEPFVQAAQSLARSDGGLGVGLTLVRRLVELHQGTVTAASPGPGQGSEFVVRLPLLTGEGARKDEGGRLGDERGTGSTKDLPLQPSSLSLPTSGKARVLVVEDNADAADTLLEMLELWGYDAATVGNGPAALETMRAGRAEVILLDIGLPGMDGYEVARRLRGELGYTGKLVALTGYGREEDRQKSRAAGCDRHLTKPVNPDTLRRLLEGLPTPGPAEN